MLKTANIRGVTLIDVTIVSLITAAAIAGFIFLNSMMHEDKLNTVIAESSSYSNAIRMFYMKYKFYPGDFPHASATFGAKCGRNDPSICNGNGNNIIDIGSEDLEFWEHLSLGDFIKHKKVYDPNYIIEKNIPDSAVELAGYWAGSNAACSNAIMQMALARYGEDMLGTLNGGSLNVADTKAIDTKMDDGNPASGIVLVDKSKYIENDKTMCVDQIVVDGCDIYEHRQYVIDDKTINCIPHFVVHIQDQSY